MFKKTSSLVQRILSLIITFSMICATFAHISFAVSADTANGNSPQNILLLEVGNRVKLTAPIGKTSWNSDNSAVATVYSDGTIVGLSEGNVIITATTKSSIFFFGKKQSETQYYVTVFEPETDHFVNHSYTIRKGESLVLNAEGFSTKWKSSNRAIVSVSAKGIATAKQEGIATITAISYKTTWKHFGWLFAFFSRTERIHTNFTITVLPTSTPEPTVPSNTEETLPPETQEETEPKPTEEPSMPTMPESASEADEYYWGNSTVIDIIDAKESPDVMTGTEAISFFEDRGFIDFPVTYSFTMDGQYISNGNAFDVGTEKTPTFQTEYVSKSGEVWIIYIINGQIMANPVSYNLESMRNVQLLISESSQLTSYDCETGRFYVTIPDESVAIVRIVSQIDAETLNFLTSEEIDKL